MDYMINNITSCGYQYFPESAACSNSFHMNTRVHSRFLSPSLVLFKSIKLARIHLKFPQLSIFYCVNLETTEFARTHMRPCAQK